MLPSRGRARNDKLEAGPLEGEPTGWGRRALAGQTGIKAYRGGPKGLGCPECPEPNQKEATPAKAL